ncbi:MAG: DUF979 family protein [Candidatus Dormibacteraeota bacterium]|uniref:DUF979 family protein n=1 Tax=Candidatus Aeolococcus gillhamiae TaxID=3127015 RepID=A0A2W5Z6A0_9BACT|nr:DUF979 family protein [Candidatus Dormibacteraeota bacterium]PZR78256.1 MAG: hypothetical protein DLM65_13535 [Candidatus Dormibacter sp. RRmetagenome_bin12]
MSTDTSLVYQTDENTQRRTFLVGVRLFLAANTMLMLAMLFAYLYLRANNNGGMWRPDGIGDLSGLGMAIILVLQAACLVAVIAAIGLFHEDRSTHRVVGVIALLLALAAGVGRVWYQYHLGSGWVINHGTYTAVTEMWFGILIIEALVGVLWLFTVVLPGRRAAHPLVAARQLRGFAEYWGYLLVVSTLVFLLARLV